MKLLGDSHPKMERKQEKEELSLIFKRKTYWNLANLTKMSLYRKIRL
jgi:hypothetical protein